MSSLTLYPQPARFVMLSVLVHDVCWLPALRYCIVIRHGLLPCWGVLTLCCCARLSGRACCLTAMCNSALMGEAIRHGLLPCWGVPTLC